MNIEKFGMIMLLTFLAMFSVAIIIEASIQMKENPNSSRPRDLKEMTERLGWYED